MYFISVDIGTTHTKVLLTGAEQTILFANQEINPTYFPHPGWHEQHAGEISAIVFRLIQQAAQVIPDKSSELVLCFSAAMHGWMAVDENGEAITPLLTWADLRSIPFAREYAGKPIATEIYRHTGLPLHPVSPLCKTAWFREQHPQLFEKAARFVSVKEYILYKLCGEWVIDYSLASATGFFNPVTKNWHQPSLALAGITAHRLSEPVPVNYQLKSANREIISYKGPVSIIIGASDGALANIGSGVYHPGQAGLTIGTSAALRGFIPAFRTDPQQRLFCYAFDEEMYLCGGATNNGGNLLAWFMKQFPDAPQENEAFIRFALTAESTHLVMLPYVYGERAPVWDPEAIPVFSSAGADTKLNQRARAMLEGIGFNLDLIAEAMRENGDPVSGIRVSGGFTAFPDWIQLMADIFQIPFYTTDGADASVRGACLLAMKTRSLFKQWTDLDGLLLTKNTFTPDPAKKEIYKPLKEKFKSLYLWSIRQRPGASGELL